MTKETEEQIERAKQMLIESNSIEAVFDDDSLLQATYAWEYMIEQDEITPHDVLRVHKILMLHQKLLADEKGYFRRCAVFIAGDRGMEHKNVPKAIAEWCHDMNINAIHRDDTENDKEEISKRLHIQYEKIHPFVDGNGRTGRIFMNWWRIRNGLEVKTIQDICGQSNYYDWFK